MVEEAMNFQDLPEGCIANVISFTTPRDACRLCLVSSTFKSAAESDAVWQNFLPSEYQTLISESSSEISSSSFNSKKQLFLYLRQHPILIDEGKKSFQLDKIWGKKVYMLSTRLLFIVWGDTPAYWKWTSIPEARFSEVAELVSVCWLEIRGWINTSMLSPNTLYGAYLVFKAGPNGTYGLEYQSVDVSIRVNGVEMQRRTVYLDPERGRRLRFQIVPRRFGMFRTRFLPARPAAVAEVPARGNGGDIVDNEYAKQRDDGWLEMELGDYFNHGGEDNELEMGVYEITGGNWKSGIVIQGIEIRPKPLP